MKKDSILLSVLFAVAAVFNGFALESLSDIVVGKTYHMILTTGDELEGIVDSKTDTSLILDCKGAPYTFIKNLIIEYKLVASAGGNFEQQDSGTSKDLLTYEDYQKKQIPGQHIEVYIKNGTVFKGSLLSIDDDNLKLNTSSSVIPLAQSVVDHIIISAVQHTDSLAVSKEVLPDVYDTIIVKNEETDEYGKAKPNSVFIGKVLDENNKTLTFQSLNNSKTDFSFDQIVQIFRHSTEIASVDSIKLYALTLICPSSMILVNVPPGKSGRPFFKTCIDKYEYPNQINETPQIMVSYDDAEQLCAKQGKRLCTAKEWQWACSGIEGYAYSYGWTFDKLACNSSGRTIEPSGARNHCTGKFGTFDMVGNVFEWVKNSDNHAAAMGGPMSKCQTIATGGAGEAKAQTGFRCCKSN